LEVPVLLDLPTSAVAPSPLGQLGLGATYFTANDNHSNTASIFLRQGALRFKGLGGVAGQSLKVGRMEFFDGAEVTPHNATLAALKRDRIAQRLLGNFGFTDVQRSLDGAQYVLSSETLNFTAFGGRPTEGVFQVDGWGELKINVFYGALTGQVGGEKTAGEWRVFGLRYSDYRENVVKTDNRSLAARTADTGSINIGTYGGHYLQVASTPAGPVDVLFWGALQAGSWGALSQRAGAYATEAGWQPPVPLLPSLRPWIRAGYDYGSGDGNPNDGTHGTFFQVLPTPRAYARLPFFNLMNSRDLFGSLILRPARQFTVRTDIHGLSLANNNDLWYSGGGAFQPGSFGFQGRPPNGHSSLATLYDGSGDFTINAHAAVGVYYGYAASGQVPEAIYRNTDSVRLGFVELQLKF
jgi:hypothetical protein